MRQPLKLGTTSVSTPTPPVDLSQVESLAHQFRPVLLQFFKRRVHAEQEAEDLTQEVFVRLVHRGHVSDVANIRGYLFECAANTLYDHQRKQRARHTEEHEHFDLERHDCADFATDDVLIGAETLSRAARALLELPERTRAIFLLRRVEGMQYQDIARRLGVSLSLVEKQMARALAYLTDRMSDE